MITITEEEILEMEQEYYYYTVGNSGSFTTHLFNALKVADMGNFGRLAKAFPAQAYLIAKEHNEHHLRLFKVIKED